MRRFALFVLLGYSLHLPVYRLLDLPLATPENWRMFQAVDVLQLVGVTLIVLQLLALVSRSRRVFMVLSFALAARRRARRPVPPCASTGPRACRPGWRRISPPPTGSLFPLLPWSAFVLAGAGLGQIYSRWGAAHLRAFARWVLLVPGAVLLVLAFVSQRAAVSAVPGQPVRVAAHGIRGPHRAVPDHHGR